ncbi:UNVERIFIED_CONTAM: hypothetical protein K2H54_004854 [Gekko kuhli]
MKNSEEEKAMSPYLVSLKSVLHCEVSPILGNLFSCPDAKHVSTSELMLSVSLEKMSGLLKPNTTHQNNNHLQLPISTYSVSIKRAGHFPPSHLVTLLITGGKGDNQYSILLSVFMTLNAENYLPYTF